MKRSNLVGDNGEGLKREIRYDSYWGRVSGAYAFYPTVKHRRRFILSVLRNRLRRGGLVFDYGCGDGAVLEAVRGEFGLDDEMVGGCDVSGRALALVRRRISSPFFYQGVFPNLDRQCQAVICSEVIEHTQQYEGVLRWIASHLLPGGLLVLTTQSGRIHASDIYTGHTQHFELKELCSLIRGLGFSVQYARRWGFPFFTAQKYMTDVGFDRVRTGYLEGDLTARKQGLFTLAYALYYIHDLIPYGPQIYVVAMR